LIKKAKATGVDAVKFQVYTPDTITTNVDNKYFQIKHPEWGGQTLYQLYKKAYTPWEWLPKLKKVTEDLGMVFFASAFDKTSVDFLEELNVCMHKISSFELNDIPLIKYAAKTKKPLVLSTGISDKKEIEAAVVAARSAGAKDIILLRCVSSYPTAPENMRLSNIGDMCTTFSCLTGLSDHTLGTATSVAAVVLGAVFIEKHFTDTRKKKTPDSFFSMEPTEFKQLVDDVRIVEKAIGKVSYQLTKKQKESAVFKRSLFAVEDIAKGELITDENVRSIRPSHGMSPVCITDVIGSRAAQKIAKGTPITKGLISS
jgi:pseudaminic acid synthase